MGVLDMNGKRFANELGRRDYVTGEMWKNKPPFRLVLNKAASDEIIWHCKHYTGRGVMKYYVAEPSLQRISVCHFQPLKQLIRLTMMQLRRRRRILMVALGQLTHQESLGTMP